MRRRATSRVVLRELGIDPDDTKRIIEVWNKADLISADDRAKLCGTVAAGRTRSRRPDPHLGADRRGHPGASRHHRGASVEGPRQLRVEVGAEPTGRALPGCTKIPRSCERETTEEGHTVLQVRSCPARNPASSTASRTPRHLDGGSGALGVFGLQPRALPSSSRSRFIEGLPSASSARSTDPNRRSNLALVPPQRRFRIDPVVAARGW